MSLNNKKIVFEPIAIDQLFPSNNPTAAGFANECQLMQKQEDVTKSISITEEELEIIKKNAFEDGYNKASNEYKKEIYDAKYFSEELSKNLIDNISAMMQEHINYEEQRADLMLKIAVKSAEKIAHQLLNDNAQEIIKNNIKKALDMLIYEPQITISVHPNMLDNVKKIIDQLSKISQYKGKIEIISDNNIHQINCNIEWQDGIIEVDHENLWATINKVIEN
jgi:flagellar biosynthesis/type III secretory pathway protein FliH